MSGLLLHDAKAWILVLEFHSVVGTHLFLKVSENCAKAHRRKRKESNTISATNLCFGVEKRAGHPSQGQQLQKYDEDTNRQSYDDTKHQYDDTTITNRTMTTR